MVNEKCVRSVAQATCNAARVSSVRTGTISAKNTVKSVQAVQNGTRNAYTPRARMAVRLQERNGAPAAAVAGTLKCTTAPARRCGAAWCCMLFTRGHVRHGNVRRR